MFRRAALLATLLFAFGAAAAVLFFALVVAQHLYAAGLPPFRSTLPSAAEQADHSNYLIIASGTSMAHLALMAIGFWLLCFFAAWLWLRVRGR